MLTTWLKVWTASQVVRGHGVTGGYDNTTFMFHGPLWHHDEYYHYYVCPTSDVAIVLALISQYVWHHLIGDFLLHNVYMYVQLPEVSQYIKSSKISLIQYGIKEKVCDWSFWWDHIHCFGRVFILWIHEITLHKIIYIINHFIAHLLYVCPHLWRISSSFLLISLHLQN